MSKRMLVFALCLCMALCMLPSAALADAPQNITAAGLDLSAPPAVETTYTAGGGTVVWTPAAGSEPATLTFTNATINCEYNTKAFTLPNTPVKVVFSGTNSITPSYGNDTYVFHCAAATTFDLSRGSSTTLNVDGHNSTGIYSNGAVIVNGDGATLTINVSGSSTQTINAPNSPVTLNGGTMAFTGKNGIRAGAITLNGVTVPAGASLSMSESRNPTITYGSSSSTVYGEVVMPYGRPYTADDFTHFTGSGTIRLRPSDKTYSTDGYESITSTGLDLTTPPTEATTYTAGNGTVVWTPATSTTPATLTLNNAMVNVTAGARAFELPSNQAVKVVFNGTNSISATDSMNSGVAFGCNNVTTFVLNANSSTTLSANAQYAYAISLRSSATLEITGSGALNIEASGGDRYPSAISANSDQSVTLTGGTLSANAPIGGNVTLGGVRVLGEDTLNLIWAASITKGASGAVINGALLLKDGTTQAKINELGLTGSGTVQLVDYSSMHNWNTTAIYRYNSGSGQWQLAVPPNGLDLTTAPTAETTWLAGSGTVTYIPAKDPAPAKLVFDGASVNVSGNEPGATITAVTLPNAQMDVIFKGTNEINAVNGNRSGSAVTFSASNDVTFTAEANSKTTLNARGNESKAIYSSGGNVALYGPGELILAPAVNKTAQKPDGYAIHAGSNTVTIDGGSVYEKRDDTDSATNVISGIGGILAGAVNLTADSIPVGGTLDLGGINDAVNVARGNGALLNNGTLILPSGSDVNGMNITGSGVVKIGDSYYKNVNGKWVTDITNVGLNLLSNAPTEATSYAAGDGTVTYTPGAGGNPPTLTLNNATIAPIAQGGAPAVPPLVLGSAKLELVGSSYLKGTGVPALCGADGNSVGNITVGGSGSLRLDGKSESLGSFGANSLTLEDTATVTSTSGTVVTAPVVGEKATLNAILKVNGKQTVYGKNTIAEGAMRDYSNEDLDWTNGASMEVNGVLTLKKDTVFADIKNKLSGSGIVRIVTETDGDGKATAWDSYRTDGTKLHAYPNGLNFSLAAGENQGYWKEGATLEADGYTFTGNTADGYVLTLGDLDIFPNQSDIAALTLPVDGKVEVRLAGDTRIQNGGPAMKFTKLATEYPCAITGTGKLSLRSDYLSCLDTAQPLTIAGGYITITNSGSYGIDAGSTALTISGGRLNITAKTSAVRADSLTLNGMTIVSPAGAAFNAEKKSILGADGKAVAAVTIMHVYSDDDFTPVDVTVYNDINKSAATIWLTGSGLMEDDLLITERNPKGDEYDALYNLANGNEVFSTYNIYLRSGIKWTNSATYLHFDLATKYAGQAFTLVHQKADKTYEYFFAKADINGDLTFGPLYELSPFMLVHGTLTQNTTVAVTVEPPQTADSSNGAMIGVTMLALAAIAGAMYIALRKRA